MEGMLVVRQPLAFRWRAGGKAVAIRTELDYALVTPQGRVSWVDAKLWAKPRYPRSALTPHQVTRAYTYNLHKVPAGFVVLFAQADVVVFFTGIQARALRPRQSLAPQDGLVLGSSRRFWPSRLFAVAL